MDFFYFHKKGVLLIVNTKLPVYYRILNSNEQSTHPLNNNYRYLVVKVDGYDNIGVQIPLVYKIIKYWDGSVFKLQVLFD